MQRARTALAMSGCIDLPGCWDHGMSLGYHNVDPVAGPRLISINVMGCRLTPLGRLVRAAKYEANSNACARLVSSATQAAARAFVDIDQVYYIASRDSASGLTREVARHVAALLTPSREFRPAFDWSLFPTFKKGMTEPDVASLLRKSRGSKTETPIGACLLIDDTIWSGSTLSLGSQYLAAMHTIIRVLCLSAVRQLK